MKILVYARKKIATESLARRKRPIRKQKNAQLTIAERFKLKIIIYLITPNSLPTFSKAINALSKCSCV